MLRSLYQLLKTWFFQLVDAAGGDEVFGGVCPEVEIPENQNVFGFQGKGAERSGGGKTLVSFPVKQPHVWPSETGENAAHPSAILRHLEVGRESSVDPGQKTARSEPRHEEDDSSSSSSSSSSDSDSDLEEDKKGKEAAKEKKKNQSDPKWGSDVLKTQTGQPGTREQEILGGEKAGEDLTHVPQAARMLKRKPKLQNIPPAGEKATTGDQDLTGEQSEDVAPGVDTKSGKKTLGGGKDLAGEGMVDVAPAVDSKSKEKTPGGGQDLIGEELVDVAPAVDRKVQNIRQSMEKTPSGGQDLSGEDLVDVAPAVDTNSKEKTPSGGQDLSGEDLVDNAPAVDTNSKEKTPSGGQDLSGEDLVDITPAVDTKSMEKTPSGGQDLSGEDLVDITPAVDTKSKEKTPSGGQDLAGEGLLDVAPAVDTKSEEKIPSGGQDLSGEDLVDVAPTLGTEKPVHGEARAAEGRLASSSGQEVGETQSSGGNNKDLSEEPSVSSPDRLAESDDRSPSLTPPPPSAAPPPEEPFDNSKYQNQQHFSYTTFTFVDYDVDLSKYRLPQPSSGRPSPFH
ncbi:NADH dehydrogenase [ubiquinone] flavoprotein 3, mitochondrial [Lithobates pipiens]